MTWLDLLYCIAAALVLFVVLACGLAVLVRPMIDCDELEERDVHRPEDVLR